MPFQNPNNFNPPGIQCERLSEATVNNCLVEGCTVNSIGTWQDAGTLTESNNVVENSKAINAGTETNNNIGRHA